MADKASTNELRDGTASPTVMNTSNYVSIHTVGVYAFMDHAYEGTHGFRDGSYLVPHPREMFYDRRRDFCFYTNFVRPITRAMFEPVFIEPAPRTVDPDSSKFKTFIEDADNAGSSLQSITEDVILFARLHGIAFAVMDNFKEEDQPETAGEAEDQRVMPYLYTRTIEQVEEWKVDKFGNMKSITFIEASVWAKDTGDSEATEHKRWIEWTEEEQITWTKDKDEKWVEVERVIHDLGKVPVVMVLFAKRKNKTVLLVNPPLYDAARVNHTMFNKDSEIREIERAQGFSQLYVQTDNINSLTVGANNVLGVPMDATIPPGYVSPDPGIQKELVAYQEKVRDDLFRVAEQNGVIGIRTAKSGEALAWEFYAHESVLQKSSSAATIFEGKVADIFMLYTNEKFTYTVEYPKKFQPRNKKEILGETAEYIELEPGAKGKALALEKATKVMFVDDDQDRVDEVVQEIKDNAENEGLSEDEERRRAEEEEAERLRIEAEGE